MQNPDVLNVYTESQAYDPEDVVLAILAKDKACSLPFYLDCIYHQTYEKEHIHLYIRTNDNTDETCQILTQFLDQHGNEYASVYFDNSSISEQLKQYSNHEWNTFRFNILGKIRQDSIEYAKQRNAHYFVVDCDNFIVPNTLDSMMRNKKAGVVSPMLISTRGCYSNYHYVVDSNGYYKNHHHYYTIFHQKMKGAFQAECVHCTYLIPNEFLPSVYYLDGSNRYEYVIFSHCLRKANIAQYIDNSQSYGYLTFAETKKDFDNDWTSLANKFAFHTKVPLN